MLSFTKINKVDILFLPRKRIKKNFFAAVRLSAWGGGLPFRPCRAAGPGVDIGINRGEGTLTSKLMNAAERKDEPHLFSDELCVEYAGGEAVEAAEAEEPEAPAELEAPAEPEEPATPEEPAEPEEPKAE